MKAAKFLTVSIAVLAHDIARAERSCSNNCMVAAAVKRAVRPSLFRKDLEFVDVASSRTYVGGTRTPHTLATAERIERWDEGATNIKPFKVRVKFDRAHLRPSFLKTLNA